MSPANQDAIYMMMGFIALIVVAILTPFILKAIKKRKPTLEKEISPLEPAPENFRDALKTVEEENKNLRQALSHTEANIFGRLKGLFSSGKPSPAFEDIEEVLYTSDLGPKTVEKLMESLRENLNTKEKN